MRLIAAALTLALAGCAASTQQPLSASKAAPAAQVTYQAPSGATVRLVVQKDSFFMPTAAPREIHLDGVLAATLFDGEFVTLLVKAGDHVIGARNPRNLFDGTIVTASVNAEAGQTYYFRTGHSQNGELTFTRAMPPS